MGGESKKTYQKAGVVVRKRGDDGEDRFLLISARRHEGSWVFPAGTVEEGELPRQAAARECEEESGYVVRPGEKIGEVVISEREWTKNFVFFSAVVVSEVERREEDRLRRWVGVSRLESEVAGVFAPIARIVAGKREPL